MSKVIARTWLERDGMSALVLRHDPSPRPASYPDEYELLMHDCTRQCHWMFTKDRKGRAKLAKIKKIIDELDRRMNE